VSPKYGKGVSYTHKPGKPPETITYTADDGTKTHYSAKEKERTEQERTARAVERPKVEVIERSPYGPDSQHSWILDRALTADRGIDPAASERLNRDRAAGDREQRAVGSSTLGGLIPAVISPWVAEAVAYGVRSTAPLATALLRLELPPVGMSAAWAKVTTPATVTNQTAENTAMTASGDVVVGSATDPLGTIGAFLDFSVQSQERSGGWFDRVAGEELGRAYGARLEQQIWAGTGANGQLKGFTVAAGFSSSTVSGQTVQLVVNKIGEQFSQVSTNLGSAPDLIAMAPRRYAQLETSIPPPTMPDDIEIVDSPAAPLTLGGGTEDWIVVLNRAAVPLVSAEAPSLEFHREGPSAGPTLLFRWLVYGYAALGVSRRPEGVGLVKGGTPPVFT
jgi:hypothetical protein